MENNPNDQTQTFENETKIVCTIYSVYLIQSVERMNKNMIHKEFLHIFS